MSVQLYISGEAPKSFGSLAEFVLHVKARYIDAALAVASSASNGSLTPAGADDGATGKALVPPSSHASGPTSEDAS